MIRFLARMNNLGTCKECEAIALELRDAYADAWISSDEESREAWIATYKLIGGTEEDAIRAKELASAAQFRDPLRINQVFLRKLAHEARSGHKVAWID
jgi:formiminotetrahydrofolate cyclodeaminase